MSLPEYPAFARGHDAVVRHGRTVADPYRALESMDQTAEWLVAQNSLARERLDALEAMPYFRRAVAGSVRRVGRGLPAARGSRLFFAEGTARERARALLVQDGESAPRILLEAPGDARITGWNASPDGSLLAVHVCEAGSETGPLRVIGVDESIESTVAPALRAPAVAWAGTAGDRPRGLYFCNPRPSAERGQGIWFLDFADGRRHRVWAPECADDQVFAVPTVSPCGRWMMIAVRYGADRRNALLLARIGDQRTAPLEPRVLLPAGRMSALARFGSDGCAYVLSLPQGSPPRIQVFDPEDPEPESWRSLIEGLEGRPAGFAPLSGAVAVSTAGEEDGAVWIIDARSGERRRLPLPGTGSIRGMTAAPDERGLLWVEYAHHGEPEEILVFRVGRPDPQPEPWFRPDGPIRLARTRLERETYASADGTAVRISILSRRDLPPGPRPLMLAVYGGFGLDLMHRHSDQLEAWVGAGGAHAIAHVRGGGEGGADWHAAATGPAKPRSVEDLISAAEYLVGTERTTPEQLVVVGGSNGGMLAAAAAIRRPDLFRACIPIHAVTDMLRYDELGEGASWLAEYGDPADAEVFTAMLSYSPYHCVVPATRYPAFLLMAGESDLRVPPAHARKLCAALQHATDAAVETAPVLLREARRAGHGGLGEQEAIDWYADRLAFAAWSTGLATETYSLIADNPQLDIHQR